MSEIERKGDALKTVGGGGCYESRGSDLRGTKDQNPSGKKRNRRNALRRAAPVTLSEVKFHIKPEYWTSRRGQKAQQHGKWRTGSLMT